MCKHAVRKLPFLIRYVPDQLKTQQMYDKAILENDGTLMSVPECYKNQQLCDKAVEKYLYVLEFVPECSKTPNKYVIKMLILIRLQYNLFLNAIRLKKCVIKQFIDFFVFDSIPDQYKIQEICDIVVSLYPF